MNKHQSNKGFTLVEVIVVAVIVAILAAVAIPLYTGYVKDSRVSLVNSTAGSVASLLATAKNTGGADATAATAAVTTGTFDGPISISISATKKIDIPTGVNITVGAAAISGTHDDVTNAVAGDYKSFNW